MGPRAFSSSEAPIVRASRKAAFPGKPTSGKKADNERSFGAILSRSGIVIGRRIVPSDGWIWKPLGYWVRLSGARGQPLESSFPGKPPIGWVRISRWFDRSVGFVFPGHFPGETDVRLGSSFQAVAAPARSGFPGKAPGRSSSFPGKVRWAGREFGRVLGSSFPGAFPGETADRLGSSFPEEMSPAPSGFPGKAPASRPVSPGNCRSPFQTISLGGPSTVSRGKRWEGPRQ